MTPVHPKVAIFGRVATPNHRHDINDLERLTLETEIVTITRFESDFGLTPWSAATPTVDSKSVASISMPITDPGATASAKPMMIVPGPQS